MKGQGCPVVNRRYTKGVPFLIKKWYIEEYEVGPRGGALPYKTWLSTPSSPPLLRRTGPDLSQAKRLLLYILVPKNTFIQEEKMRRAACVGCS